MMFTQNTLSVTIVTILTVVKATNGEDDKVSGKAATTSPSDIVPRSHGHFGLPTYVIILILLFVIVAACITGAVFIRLSAKASRRMQKKFSQKLQHNSTTNYVILDHTTAGDNKDSAKSSLTEAV
ncbi:hypothetical protein HOLleu_40003 [Holothuria leucospilota]|uniref:Uncharacterized protein n=1 Tax=Holothuria leucospilota TaxID=206669 RepID=A0A9Q1BCG6_HOLLE|nr:hypothetical protein HOLleu_40003 [Holothuria leucospilota]